MITRLVIASIVCALAAWWMKDKQEGSLSPQDSTRRVAAEQEQGQGQGQKGRIRRFVEEWWQQGRSDPQSRVQRLVAKGRQRGSQDPLFPQGRVQRFVAKRHRQHVQSPGKWEKGVEYCGSRYDNRGRYQGRLRRVKRGIRGRIWGCPILVVERVDGCLVEVILPRHLARDFLSMVSRGSWVDLSVQIRPGDFTTKGGDRIVAGTELVVHHWSANGEPAPHTQGNGWDYPLSFDATVLDVAPYEPDPRLWLLTLEYAGPDGDMVAGMAVLDCELEIADDAITRTDGLLRAEDEVLIEADLTGSFASRRPRVLTCRVCILGAEEAPAEEEPAEEEPAEEEPAEEEPAAA